MLETVTMALPKPVIDSNHEQGKFRPGDRAASDRSGMIGNRTGQSVGEISMGRMEVQERQHGCVEVFDVFGLGLVSASSIGLLAFGVAFNSVS